MYLKYINVFREFCKIVSSNNLHNSFSVSLFLSSKVKHYVDVEHPTHLSRIGSDAYRVVILSSRSFHRRNRGEKSPDKTRHRAYCSTGRIQWRVHNAKSAPGASIHRAGLAYATKLSVFSKTRRRRRRHQPPRPVPNPFFHFLLPFLPLPLSVCDQEVAKQRQRGCAAASPIEMHRFHYKLLMRQICLSVSLLMRYRLRYCCVRGHCLHRG